jgi:hypothetical protein
MWNIYEYPFVGIGIAAIVLAGLWVYGMFRPDKKRKWHPLIPIGIVILAVAISYFVQTDKEKIIGAINKGIAAFEKQKIEPIKEIIADGYFDTAHSSKEYIIAYCQGLFETAAIERVTFLSQQIQIENDKAVFTLEVMVKFAEQSHAAQMGKSFLIVKVRFNFKKTPDKKWLINGSEILELDRKTVNWSEIKSI